MNQPENPQHPNFEHFDDFTKVQDFSYLVKLSNQVVVNQCRMRAATQEADGAGETIKRQFGLPADSSILALYLFGEVYRKHNRPNDLTAKGHCVYFVFNPNEAHDPITRQDQLVTKRESVFYHRPNDLVPFQRETFENLTAVASDPQTLVESSSLRTGHRIENILLLP